MLLKKLLIKCLNMVEATVRADCRSNARDGEYKTVRLVPADYGAHKRRRIHRGKISPAADKRGKVIIELIRRCPLHAQGRDFLHRTHTVFAVYYLVSYFKHIISPIYCIYMYNTTFQTIFAIIFFCFLNLFFDDH